MFIQNTTKQIIEFTTKAGVIKLLPNRVKFLDDAFYSEKEIKEGLKDKVVTYSLVKEEKKQVKKEDKKVASKKQEKASEDKLTDEALNEILNEVEKEIKKTTKKKRTKKTK